MDSFLQSCIGVAVIIASSFYGYGLWIDRKNSNKLDTNKLWKDDVDALERKIKKQDDDIQHLTIVVQDLKAQIVEKDKKLSSVLEILQGRNPAMDGFIKEGTDYMKKTMPVLELLKQYLEKQSFK